MRKIKRVLKRFDRGLQRFFNRVFRVLYKLKPLRQLLRPTYRFVNAHYRLTASVLTILMVASAVIPVLQYRFTANKYELDSQAQALLGEADKDLTKKLVFDKQKQAYYFNKEAREQKKPDQNPVTGMKSQVGGSGADDEQLYSMDAPRDLSKGITYYDNQRDLSFKITPQFATLPAEVREGHIIYPLAGSSGQVAYTVTATGLKQNVVLYESPGAALNMNYKFDLPKSLEARMIDETGEVGIYSADPEVLAAIDYQASDAATRLEAARNSSEKTHLTFKIPAPVVMMQGKIDQAIIGNVKSHFLLNDNVLTVMTTGLDKAEYPLAIDPTVSIDSASEFAFGSVEDSNMTLASGNATRGGLTGGTVSSWSSTTSFPTARYFHRTVVYNDYIYVAGGISAGSDIRYAPINSDGTISSGSWQSHPGGLANPAASMGIVAYNGYMYRLGGFSGSVYDAVSYAAINSDGSLGSWSATTTLPEPKNAAGVVAYNGYMYVIGGYNGSIVDTDVYVAPIKADGSLGSWTTTTSFSSTARYAQVAVTYNGYLYVLGGAPLTDVPTNEVHYAPINSDGSLGSWAAATSMSTARRDHSAFAYNGYMYALGGRTGTNNTGTNTIEYAPINANGTLGSWTTTTSFSNARYGQTAAAYNGYLYVLGGATSGTTTARSDVLYAQLSPPGGVAGSSFTTNATTFTTQRSNFASIAYNSYLYIIGGTISGGYTNTVRYAPLTSTGATGSWSNATTLPASRGYIAATAYNGYMYVLGGWDGSSSTNTVVYNSINSNGSLGGSWSSANNFSTARDSQAAVAYNGYLYVLGGVGSGGTLNDVQYAPINSNGSLGTWNSTESFDIARSELVAVAYNGYMYVLGGTTNNDWNGCTDSVQFAKINANGELDEWDDTESLPEELNGHNVTLHNGYIYTTGGNNFNTPRQTVRYAPINEDGTLGDWETAINFSTARYGHGSVAYNGYLYVIGGRTDGGVSFRNDILYAPLNNGGPGTTGSWTSTSSFTGTRYGHGSVAYNGYMYILGGYNGSAYKDVQYAAINKTNGTLGSWSSAGPDFTTARYGLDVFVYNGYIYVLGGTTNGSVYLNDVQYAAINTDGTIGSWQTTTSFPTARYGHHVVAYDGYIYLTGGNSGSARNDVQYAQINSDGTLGSWSSGGTFTNARYGHDATINNGYIYIMAGNNSGTYYNDVQVAEIQGGGSLGSWTSLIPFSNPRYGIDSFVYNGYLYVVGGYNGSTYYADVQYAPIAPNGHIGQWQRTTDFTTARYVHTALAHNGYMYILGGNGGSYLNNVYYAPMNIMPRKATYSKILDFGSQSKITGISYTGNLIDGLRNIRYRFANSSGIFPTSAPRGADLPFTCDAGTHVQILATVDNTTSSVFPDSAGELGQINSITVTYDVPGVPTDKRLRHGAYFSSEELQPFDTRGCV